MTKIRENRLRRWAKRLGLELKRSRKRAVYVHEVGAWSIVMPGNMLLHGHLDLDGVEAALAAYELKVLAERGR